MGGNISVGTDGLFLGITGFLFITLLGVIKWFVVDKLKSMTDMISELFKKIAATAETADRRHSDLTGRFHALEERFTKIEAEHRLMSCKKGGD